MLKLTFQLQKGRKSFVSEAVEAPLKEYSNVRKNKLDKLFLGSRYDAESNVISYLNQL